MRRLAGYTAIVMATLMAVLLMWEFRSVIALFLFSLVVAAAVRPLVDRLDRAGLVRPMAVIATYLVGLVVLAAAILLVGKQPLFEIQALTDRIASSYEAAYPEWEAGSTFQQAMAARLPPPEILYETLTSPEGESLGGRVLGLSRGLIGLAAGILVILSLSVYWTIDQTQFERLWLSLLRVRHRAKARDIWRATESAVGSYLRSEVVQSVMALFILGLGYWALGLDFPFTLAVIGAVFWLIPLVGALLTIPPVFLASIGGGLGLSLLAIGFTVTVLWLLEFLVEPRLFDRRRFSPILTVLIMLVLVEDFGVLGLVIAPPLAAAIQSLATHLFSPAVAHADVNPDEYLASLKARLGDIQAKGAATGETSGPEIDSLTGRLAGLMERVDQLLPPPTPGR